MKQSLLFYKDTYDTNKDLIQLYHLTRLIFNEVRDFSTTILVKIRVEISLQLFCVADHNQYDEIL